jgi:ribosomal protein L11 methyltransferase
MLIAMLSDIGFNGFEESESELLAYADEEGYDTAGLDSVARTLGITYETETLTHQNWNALWESNFQPVIVDDICTIRAHFHDINVDTPYEIVITPKMSFGTGHHATTQLMMIQMNSLEFKGKSVLDFGTGTGVLAIFAEMLGAESIVAIDNDEWSVENAIENAGRNNCSRITVKKASIEGVPFGENDIILANINRHILLQYMGEMYGRLSEQGHIVMSGLLTTDKDVIINAAIAEGFKFVNESSIDNWIALLFCKM